MKKLTYAFTFFFLLTFFACEKGANDKMTILIDCTGTYLRQDGKDYHVCNIEKMAGFSDGETVTATFMRVEKCNLISSDSITCDLLHVNEGWIEVEKIK
jgi:hypothetical protein